MDAEQAEPQFRKLVAEWSQQRSLADTATRQAVALDKIIRGYIEMFPQFESVFEDEDFLPLGAESVPTPRGAEAVRLILQSRPGYNWWVTELVEALRSRDWLPDSDNPANAVRTALERLLASPESDVTKHKYEGKVVYTYDPDRDPDAPVRNPAPAGYDPAEEPF